MKKRLTLTILVSLNAIVCGSSAAQGEGQPPAPPYLASLGLNMRWKATVQPKSPRSAPTTPDEAELFAKRDKLSPQLESIVADKGKDGLHLSYYWKGEKRTDAWFIDGVLFIERNPNFPNSIEVQDPATDSAVPDYAKSDFPELNWVGAATFVEMTSESGKRCCLYQLRGSNPAGEAGQMPKEDRSPILKQAWVEAVSRLPVKFDDGRNVYSITYEKGNAAPITPPPAFQRWIDEMRRSREHW